MHGAELSNVRWLGKWSWSAFSQMLEAQPRRRRRLYAWSLPSWVLCLARHAIEDRRGLFPTTLPARSFFLSFSFSCLYARPGKRLSCGPAYPGKAWSPVIGPMLVQRELTIPQRHASFFILTAQCDGEEGAQNLLK